MYPAVAHLQVGGHPGGEGPHLPIMEGHNDTHKYFHRVKMVLQTRLYGRNKILAINGFALPVLTYGFGVIH